MYLKLPSIYSYLNTVNSYLLLMLSDEQIYVFYTSKYVEFTVSYIFQTTYVRKYESAEVELKRREIFIDNLNHIREHNDKYQKGEKTYYLGVNKFADKVHVYNATIKGKF